MTNDECQMTKEFLNTNAESDKWHVQQKGRPDVREGDNPITLLDFVIRASFVIWAFVIRHSSPKP